MTYDEALKKSIFLPYQIAWIIDKAAVKVWEKSRRIGASYVEGFVCAVLASLSKASGGMDCFYISYAKDMTQKFISDCAFWAHILGIACSDIEEIVLKDEDKDITVYKIRFDSGFEVWALPSCPRQLRSKQGHVVIDEAAFVDDFQELLKAAIGMLVWGGSVSILSTHNGDENPFNELIQSIHDGKKDYSLHHTTIDDALNDGLFKRICDVKNEIWSEEYQEKWLKKLLDEAGDFAEEEFYCIPVSSGSRYFPSALIQSAAHKDIPVYRHAEKDSFTFEKKWKRELACVSWFREIKSVLQSTNNPVCLGEDFARSGDLTILWFDEELPDDTTRTLCVIELRNIPFDQQWQFLQLCCKALRNFDGGAFDSRGNGQMIAELAAQEWPGSVFQVMISRKWYAENFPKLKDAFETGTADVPDDIFIKDDYKVVQIVQGVPLITERTGSVRSKRHGDSCVAKAMAQFAHNELGGKKYQPMTYEAVKVGNRYRMEGDDPWEND